jgi:hypothetical protein
MMSGDLPAEPLQVQLRIDWSAADDVVALFANQVLIQSAGPGEEVYLSFGQIAPPALIGTPEEQHAQAQALGSIPVKVVARLTISREKLNEIFGALGTFLSQQVVAEHSEPDLDE